MESGKPSGGQGPGPPVGSKGPSSVGGAKGQGSSGSNVAEIPFWIHDKPKWVSGISRQTTCQDILHALVRAERRGAPNGLSDTAAAAIVRSKPSLVTPRGTTVQVVFGRHEPGWGAEEEADAKSRWVPIVQKSYLLSSHCSPGPPNPPKSAHSRQLGPVDSCIPVG